MGCKKLYLLFLFSAGLLTAVFSGEGLFLSAYGQGISVLQQQEPQNPVFLRKPQSQAVISAAEENLWKNRRLRGREGAFVIVLDPGHGGGDSGAVGVGGVREKLVVLAFAKRLLYVLQKKAGIKAYLTRDEDIFLSLAQRVEAARQLNADLFISLHADHNDAASPRGATLYTLSDKASDSMAKLLAERENKADFPADIPNDAPPPVADILLDMTLRETGGFSEEFAGRVIRALQKNNITLMKNPHRSANFQVLRTADIPAVLLELGYLSNADDEKRITDSDWQNKMAYILAETIASFAESHGKNRKNL